MKVLFIGDIVSRAGRKAVSTMLPEVKEEFYIDFVIANGENVAGFRGMDENTFQELRKAGVDAFTSGNHIWDNKNIYPKLKEAKFITVPANYPKVHGCENPLGSGVIVYSVKNTQVAVVNIQGRVFMDPINCPFQVVRDIIEKELEEIKIILVDFHAEATSEKKAMGYYLDGKVSAVLGTHTHIQTADAEVLPMGTAYITDVGMTGPTDSILGIKKEIIIDKFVEGIPHKFHVANTEPMMSFVVLDIDENGKAKTIQSFVRKGAL